MVIGRNLRVMIEVKWLQLVRLTSNGLVFYALPGKQAFTDCLINQGGLWPVKFNH